MESCIIIDCQKEPYQDLTVELVNQLTNLFNYTAISHYRAVGLKEPEEHLSILKEDYKDKANIIIAININLDWKGIIKRKELFGALIISNPQNPDQDFSDFLKCLEIKAFL